MNKPLISIFFILIFLMPLVGSVVSSPSWSAYTYHSTSADDMTNTPPSDVLVQCGYSGNNVLSIFKAIDPTQPLIIKNFDQSGALLNTLNITVALSNETSHSVDCTFRTMQYNSTYEFISVGYLSDVSLHNTNLIGVGYVNESIYYRCIGIITNGVNYTVTYNNSAIIGYDYLTFHDNFGFSGFDQNTTVFMSNIVNDSNGNFYACVDANVIIDFSTGSSPSDISVCYELFNLISGNTVNVIWSQEATSLYYGLPILLYAPQYTTDHPDIPTNVGNIWVIASGLMIMFNPLSQTLTEINEHAVLYEFFEMNKPTDAWIIGDCYDGYSGLMSDVYFGSCVTINSSSLYYETSAYYNSSTFVTNTISHGMGYAFINNIFTFLKNTANGWMLNPEGYVPSDQQSSTNITAYSSFFNNDHVYLSGQGVVSSFYSTESTLRSTFYTVTSLGTYTEYWIDTNTTGSIISVSSQNVGTTESGVSGAYAIRYTNGTGNEQLENGGYLINPAWSKGYAVGDFAGSPETVVITNCNYRVHENPYPPVNSSYSETILSGWNTSANPIEIITDKVMVTSLSDNWLDEIAFCVNNTSLPCNYRVYVSQTNDTTISSSNKLIAIDSGSIPAGYSEVIKTEYQSSVANHTIAVGFFPQIDGIWNFSFAVPDTLIWYGQTGSQVVDYINTSSIQSQISGYTPIYSLYCINNGSTFGGNYTLTPYSYTVNSTDRNLLDHSLPSSTYHNNGNNNNWLYPASGNENYLLYAFPAFDLSNGTTIDNATLYLYYYNHDSYNPNGRTDNAYLLLSSYDPNTLTWNNQPTAQVIINASSIVPSGFGYMAFDITDYIRGVANGSLSFNGIEIRDDSGSGTYYTYFYDNDVYMVINGENNTLIGGSYVDSWTTPSLPTDMGYYFYYDLYYPPSGNDSGHYTTQNSTIWFNPFNLTTITLIPVVTPQLNDSMITAFQNWLASFGFSIQTFGFIFFIACAIITAIGLSMVGVSALIQIPIVLTELIFFTVIGFMPDYVLISVMALVIGLASVGIAKFFSASDEGG